MWWGNSRDTEKSRAYEYGVLREESMPQQIQKFPSGNVLGNPTDGWGVKRGFPLGSTHGWLVDGSRGSVGLPGILLIAEARFPPGSGVQRAEEEADSTLAGLTRFAERPNSPPLLSNVSIIAWP